MTDSWHRPDNPDPAPAQAESSIDIPLTGDGPLSVPTGSAGPPPPNWRQIIWVSSLGGVALGVLLSIVLITVVWDDDEPDGEITADPSNTLDGLDLVTRITTPPTLVSSEPTEPTEPTAPSSPAGSPLPSRDRSLLDEIAVPTFALSGTDTPTAGSFDLAIAVERLGTDVARRSSTTLELGVGGYVRSFSILRDPAGDRYGATLDRVIAVVDGQADATYLDVSSSDDERWVRTDNTQVAESLDVDSVTVLFQRLLHGPVRADTIDAAGVTPGDMVVLDDDRTTAREFTVELPGGLVPEWQLYAFGPTDEFLPSDRPTRLEYTVYVDERNEIRRVVGLSDLGGIPQLIVHDIELLDEPIGVDLPAPTLVVDEIDAT